jgi:hypothetical protein
MADWQTVSALATAGGTLVLAVATFSAVRSSNRSARVAEEALRANMRPLLVPSLATDPPQKVLWSDRHVVRIEGGRAVAEHVDDVVYLAIGVRNLGTGIALLHGWWPFSTLTFGETPPVAPEQFRRLQIDLYIASGGSGYWESALRDPDEPIFAEMAKTIAEREPFCIDVLYGDQRGGERTISRLIVMPASDDGWYALQARHWHLDRPNPR